MSEAIILALIATVPSILGLVGIVYSIRVSLGTRAIAQKTELNTNSMKDALVASTKVAAHAEGREEARAEGEAKAATLAEAVLIGQIETKK